LEEPAVPTDSDRYGTDLLLTATGDLAVTAAGGLGTVSDTANCVQALTLHVKTSRRELPFHPDYGSDLNARVIGGKSDYDLLEALAVADLRRLVNRDARFDGTDNVRVTPITRPEEPFALAALVAVQVRLAGGEALRVSDLATVRVEEVLEPATGDLVLGRDAFFTDDELEADDLRDLDAAAELLADLTPPTF